ncbi:hypothetical protein BTO05_05935 [Winogradskyella sp. PC-19]|uniref:cell envelope integrity protein TolA n=1 Tax=unclassified Winogradskyella TaxID=2615021 RepID=UPI000B3C925E|nr:MULTISPECIES: cell envelope integrity protein TolA [unclassified Winogradskyella]ARV09201.1 hypothetical protein BTO05_05935 [Winogradskyella sp. PC-19]RZN82522.1 MAG: hypothetical protein EVB12_02825 [Winogradskyella sp.]
MFQRLIFSVLVLLIGLSAFSQNDLNDYKYVVVPLQFDFVKGKDKYRVNSLTRYLFNSNGFKAVFDEEELPKDLFNNRCLAMYADVVKASGVFSTKLQIELKDCYGNQIFMSSIGKTKEKDLKKAYPIAIRKAFESVKFLDYKYNPNSEGALKNKQQSTVASKVENVDTDAEAEKATAEVERLKKEVEELKKHKALEKAKQEAEAKAQLELKRKTEEEKNKLENEQRKRLELEKSKSITDSDLLYAQPTDKGFQLVDITPKVVMVILKTAAPNVFTVKGKNAIVFKEGDTWFYSENDTKKPLNIKF